MKKSNNVENLKNDAKAPENFTVYEFTNTVSSFFANNFGDAIKVTSNISSPNYTMTNNKELAIIFREALKLGKGGEVLTIFLKDSGSILNIVIGTPNGLAISNEEKLNLENIARNGGFSVEVVEGAIIIRYDIDPTESVTLYASDSLCPFHKELEAAFSAK